MVDKITKIMSQFSYIHLDFPRLQSVVAFPSQHRWPSSKCSRFSEAPFLVVHKFCRQLYPIRPLSIHIQNRSNHRNLNCTCDLHLRSIYPPLSHSASVFLFLMLICTHCAWLDKDRIRLRHYALQEIRF
jgi:hypothetical protein